MKKNRDKSIRAARAEAVLSRQVATSADQAVFEVIHAGTVLSCRVTANVDSTAMHVHFDSEARMEKPDVIIPVKGKSPVTAFCPSVEGTVILCILKSGEERIYDTRTGKRLPKKELKDRSEEIHFYQ